MTGIQQLLNEYSESHQHPANKLIHWICVPLIVWSLLAMLTAIQVPAYINELPLNWAIVISACAMVYYFLLSVSLAFGILLVFSIMLLIAEFVANTGVDVLQVAVIVFVIAWIGQFIGHKIEGKKPSFFKDLQFLLIGPLWLLSFVYQKLGVNYLGK